MANPTTGVLDDFNRADNASLGANWSTDPFNEAAESPQIVSNQVANHASTSYNVVWWNASTFGPNSEAYITIPTNFNTGAYRAIYLIVNVQDPDTAASTGDGYMVEWDRDGNVNFYEYANGSTGAAFASTTGVTMSANDQAFFESKDGTLTFYRNGVSQLSAADATYTGLAGYIGFGMYDQATKAGRLDNFGGGTIVAATTLHTLSLLGVGK